MDYMDSLLVVGLLDYTDTFVDYDPLLVGVGPSNPWMTDDLSFWEINKPMLVPAYYISFMLFFNGKPNVLTKIEKLSDAVASYKVPVYPFVFSINCKSKKISYVLKPTNKE